MDGKKKKSRKERLAEQRALDKELGFTTGTGVNYSKIADRHLDDDRYERELQFKKMMEEGKSVPTVVPGGAPAAESTDGKPKQNSATYDAFMRMMTGKEERTIADKIADSNRPTWDEYKKKNEEALDMEGVALRKMMEYRKQLDEERERELARKSKHKNKRKKSAAISDSDDESSDEDRKKKKKKKDKKHKKEKKHKKKHKKHKRSSASDDDDSSGSPVPLSSFLKGSDSE